MRFWTSNRQYAAFEALLISTLARALTDVYGLSCGGSTGCSFPALFWLFGFAIILAAAFCGLLRYTVADFHSLKHIHRVLARAHLFLSRFAATVGFPPSLFIAIFEQIVGYHCDLLLLCVLLKILFPHVVPRHIAFGNSCVDILDCNSRVFAIASSQQYKFGVAGAGKSISPTDHHSGRNHDIQVNLTITKC
jgi:hypothetical protein